MKYNPYIGHDSQLCCIEEVRLVGGKGDGMRLLQVRNATGLEMTICPDRCADIYRLIFKGESLGYFSPSGYVAPAYYNREGDNFLRCFTAGFLTTCGLTNAGNPSVENGEALPTHGSIQAAPCEHIWWTEEDDCFMIHAIVPDGQIFEEKLELHRTIRVGKWENSFTITDTVVNKSHLVTPLMLLYHMNIGYPLLSENTVLDINSIQVQPRDEFAAQDLDTWNKITSPIPGIPEQCYYHKFEKNGAATVYNPDIEKGLTIRFDPEKLNHFTQWKMMGCREYVLGLEPGNCHPDGRPIMRSQGQLKFLNPGETETYSVTVELFDK